MRIVFMGTPEFAVPTLEALVQSEEHVVGVVTQPDRPKGRGGALAAPPVKLVCQRAGLPFLQPLKMKDPAFLDALRAWRPDLIVVAAFGRILPQVILDIPPRGCLNVHASLLPKYRGAGPIQWAIINGEKETGITTMLMDAGMDTGAILLQERVVIDPEDTAGTLSAKLADVGGRLLIETIRRLEAGTLKPTPQDQTRATLAPLLKKEDGMIDWTLPATAIANRVRGLSPWPGAFTFFNDDRLLIWRASAREDERGASVDPGTLVEVRKDALVIATGKGTLAVTEVQPATSRRMTVRQYLAGHPLAPGVKFSAGSPPTRENS
jgi:methionyl-tRNA formyltransferase